MRLSLKLRSLKPQHHKKKKHKAHAGDYKNCFPGGKIIALHRKQIADHFQIRKAERRYTLRQNAAVDNSKEQPEYGNHCTEQCSSAHGVHQKQRCKHDQRIIKEDQIPVYHKAARFEERMPRYPLDHEAHPAG